MDGLSVEVVGLSVDMVGLSVDMVGLDDVDMVGLDVNMYGLSVDMDGLSVALIVGLSGLPVSGGSVAPENVALGRLPGNMGRLPLLVGMVGSFADKKELVVVLSSLEDATARIKGTATVTASKRLNAAMRRSPFFFTITATSDGVLDVGEAPFQSAPSLFSTR